MTDADDRRLIQECLAGRPRSFEALVERYYKVLFNVALRMLHDREDARDVTQSAFLKAFVKLASFDPEHKFFSWIYRILVNEALDALARRRPQQPLDPETAAPQKGADELLDDSRTSDAIGVALMRVSLDHREVLILRHFLSLSYAEMSVVLGLPEKTVKSRLFSARRSLGEVLLARGAPA
jgi:RNA polymerase sigma-70 factor (ECF subfamily)